MPMHTYYGSGADWGGWMLVHGAFWLLLVALLVFGVVMLVRRPRSPSRDSALDILNERYARGEIDRDEYLQRKKDLLEP